MNTHAQTITLSLISHTNVGKTTLARTLLKRDIGEVRDATHVTDVSTAHEMIKSSEGHRLLLWDTPGFGDSIRLLRRLRQSANGNPVGWFLHEVWDRWANRALWCSQQAVRNVRDDADVVLYLVNAAESPGDAAYVEAEMEILGLLGRPVVVLLNHVGQDPAGAAAVTEAWNRHLRGRYELVRQVTDLDAFSRCWTQEDALLELVASLVDPVRQPAARLLARAWRAQNVARFEQSIDLLTTHLLRVAEDRERLPTRRGLPLVLDRLSGRIRDDRVAAGRALAERLDASSRQTFEHLLRLHGLDGEAGEKIQTSLRDAFVTGRGLDETSSALLGGLVSGAISGLAADFLAGGLTFGGGAVAGAILGASGATLVAKGYNLLQQDAHAFLRWSPEMLLSFVRLALLRYLAVAHFGRGRGGFREAAYPDAWPPLLDAVMAPRMEAVRTALEAVNATALRRHLLSAADSLLTSLHPH